MANPNDVTIADVARVASVSRSTVSRILNGKPDVSPETRQRVQRVIAEMGFRPHALAKRLATGKSHTIALLHPFERPSPRSIRRISLLQEFIIGAAIAAEEQGYFLNIVTSPVTPDHLLDLYRGVQVDGVVLMEIFLHDWRVEALCKSGHPFVMIGRRADNDGLSYVDVDFDSAIRAICDHLIDLGHRQIGFLGFPDSLRQAGYGPAYRTHASYVQAMNRHGLPPIYREVNFNVDDGSEATLALLDEYPSLTAIIPGGVLPGVVINALRQRGYRVPEDFSVAGLTGDSFAETVTPPLTAVNFPSFEMGYQATSILIKKLEQTPVSANQVLLSPPLTVRESTGPARR